MQFVSHILQSKGFDVWSISPDASVLAALREMKERNIGALLVIDRNGLAGIISERDCARTVVLEGKTAMDTLVKDVMSDHTVCVHPTQTVDDCMELMTEKRLRHLPVVKEGQLVGVVSIGDVVKAIITDKAEAIEQLERYLWRRSG